MPDFAAAWANRHDGECEAPTVEARAREIVRAGWNLTHNWMELPATANDLIREVSRALGCHCYRRWLEARLIELEKQDEIHWKTRRTLLKENERLEGRLGEVESKLRGAVQAFDAADAIAVREKRRADDLARRLDILAQGMAGLLPPKGAE